MLLRSDGHVAICGTNDDGQCNCPPCGSWSSILRAKLLHYIPNPVPPGKTKVLQLSFTRDTGAEMLLTCCALSGESVLQKPIAKSEKLLELHQGIAKDVKEQLQNLALVLDGQLVTKICQANPGITVADLFIRYRP